MAIDMLVIGQALPRVLLRKRKVKSITKVVRMRKVSQLLDG